MITVLFNGVAYDVPSTGEEGWGEDLTNYLVAIASGALQKTGGAFTLTADVNFGANFGLLSKYFETRSSNPSTAGLVRLALADTIGWRNNANSGNLLLAVNGSDQLTFNGGAIITGGITALTGDVTATGPGSAVATIADGVITNAKVSASAAIAYSKLNLALSILNADISASAAISFSKLATLTSANILVGSAGNVATSVTVTGDVTISNAGVTAIGANKVTDAMLATIATASFKGRTTAGTGNVEVLTATQATAILNAMVGDSGSGGTKGLVPAPASGDAAAGKVLKADGTWGTAGTTSPLTTKGDIYGYSTVNARVPVGTNFQVLQAASAQTLGVAYDALHLDQAAAVTGILPNANTTAASAATASAIVARDSNANTTVNDIIKGYQTIVSAAGTTVLTVASPYSSYVTGTTTQIFTLPVTSTLVLNRGFQIVNTSTGVVTINSSGGNLVATLAAGTSAIITCILTSGTTAASWSVISNPVGASLAPTVQKFTSGSGTYTTPTNPSPLFIRVRIIGGGGGGAPGGPTITTPGGNGGTSTFGTSMFSCTGGTGGTSAAKGGAGGVGSLGTGPIGTIVTGGDGESANGSIVANQVGGNGGGGFFGGGGAGGFGSAGAGNAGIAYGSGGGGGGANTNSTGSGGGAGGYAEGQINNPLSSYSYTCGAAGSAGTGSAAAGAGAPGYIEITEYYPIVSTVAATLVTGQAIAPTVQKFLSGSGTYTTPTNPAPLAIYVQMVGGGGGGGGGGSGGGTGGTGGNTTFGTTLLVANAGTGGANAGVSSAGGAGGTASLGSGPIGIALTGGSGAYGYGTPSAGANGAPGAGTPFGGSGGSLVAGIGAPGVTNTGAGGGGGSDTALTAVAGNGGGAGGYISAIINNPLSSYSYACGAAGSAGTAGTSGGAGGAGGSGAIIVTEVYAGNTVGGIPVANQTASTAYAGPSFGAGAASPAFRQLVPNDLLSVSQAKTTTYAILATDDYVTGDATGGIFTMTLPAANSVPKGKQLIVKKIDSTLTQITLSRAGSDTIDGATSTTLATQYEAHTLLSDGSSLWSVVNHTYPTISNAYTPTITGTSVNPTKATTTIADAAYWIRQGSYAVVRYDYRHTNNAGSASGTGTYLFSLPSGMSIDTSKIYINNAVSGSGVVGTFTSGDEATTSRSGVVTAYDSTHFAAANSNSTASTNLSFIGSGSFPLNTSALYYSMILQIPIVGWK